jgi:hypothetical protein
VDDTAAGQSFACPNPKCGAKVTVPASQPTQSAGPPPPSKPSATASPPPPSKPAGAAAPPPPSSTRSAAGPPPPSDGRGSAAPQPSTGTPPPPSATPYEDFDDIEDEGPQHGSYSSGFLATAIDSKMAALRGTTNSFFLGTSSQVFKLSGDIALLIVAVAWLGMGLHAEFKADDDAAGEGDAVENMEKAKEDEETKKKNTENAAIFTKTIQPLLKERCYDCHQGKEAKAKLDLSVFEDNDETGIMGLMSVIGENAGNSEIVTRVKSTDDPMPPEDKGEMFSTEQTAELTKWIDAGAPQPELGVDAKALIRIAGLIFVGVLPIAFVLILHYLTGVLFNAGDSLIKSTPSRLSSSGLMKALALVVLLAGFAAGAAGIVYGIIDATQGFSDNWLKVLAKIGGGVVLYLFCASLARLWLKPAQLNIKVGPGNSAGDEALGIMAMFSKTMLKTAPIIYGLALIFCLMFTGMQILSDEGEVAPPTGEAVEAPAVLGPAAPNEGVVAGLLTLAKETLGDAVTYFKESPLTVASKYVDKASVLSMAIKIPVYLFFYFLFSYVMVEALRALFSLPGRRS